MLEEDVRCFMCGGPAEAVGPYEKEDGLCRRCVEPGSRSRRARAPAPKVRPPIEPEEVTRAQQLAGGLFLALVLVALAALTSWLRS